MVWVCMTNLSRATDLCFGWKTSCVISLEWFSCIYTFRETHNCTNPTVIWLLGLVVICCPPVLNIKSDINYSGVIQCCLPIRHYSYYFIQTLPSTNMSRLLNIMWADSFRIAVLKCFPDTSQNSQIQPSDHSDLSSKWENIPSIKN